MAKRNRPVMALQKRGIGARNGARVPHRSAQPAGARAIYPRTLPPRRHSPCMNEDAGRAGSYDAQPPQNSGPFVTLGSSRGCFL
jgi:hypothetical protein